MVDGLEDTTSVEQQYSWRGELIGYRIDTPERNMFICVASGNRRYRVIKDLIDQGKCNELPPRFGFAYEVVGQKGKITGHETKRGFVPICPENALRLLLDEGLTNGSVEPRGKAAKPELPRCSHVKFVVFFDSAWPHLKSHFTTIWRYRSSAQTPWHEVSIRMSNLVASESNEISLAMEKLGVSHEHSIPVGANLKKGIMEVAFRIDSLNKLFRSEKAHFCDADEYLLDHIEMAQTRDDRVGDSIRIHTLIDLSPYYLRRATIDIANQVADSFNREFGGKHVGLLKEQDLSELQLCLLLDETDGRHHVNRIGLQPSHNFQLEGDWRRQEDDLTDESRLTWETAPVRIRSLIESGFAPEAISVANGFLELVYKSMLASLVRENPQGHAWVLSKSSGYNRILKIFKEVLSHAEERYGVDELVRMLKSAEKIYAKRNAYMHNLTILDHDFTRSMDLANEAKELLGFVTGYGDRNLLACAEALIRSNGTYLGEVARCVAVTCVQDIVDDSYPDSSSTGVSE